MFFFFFMASFFQASFCKRYKTIQHLSKPVGGFDRMFVFQYLTRRILPCLYVFCFFQSTLTVLHLYLQHPTSCTLYCMFRPSGLSPWSMFHMLLLYDHSTFKKWRMLHQESHLVKKKKQQFSQPIYASKTISLLYRVWGCELQSFQALVDQTHCEPLLLQMKPVCLSQLHLQTTTE